MKRSHLLAVVTAASVAVGSWGASAWTANREAAPQNLPVLLKHGTVYVSKGATEAGAAAPDAAGRRLYVVQFTGSVRNAFKAAVTRTGAEMGDYLPENAFLVRMTANQAAQVKTLGFVKGLTAYTPAMKLDRGIAKLGGSEQVRVRITTFNGGTKGPVAALSSLGVRPDGISAGVMTATLAGGQLLSLAASSDVVFVEPLRTNQLFNDKAAGVMGVGPVWSTGLTGKGQVVAVTDTGLDTGKNDTSMHPDFQGQIKALFALGKTGDASDTLAHGTHVAGSVLGTGAASNGAFKGMAPGAQLVFQSVEDGKGGLGGIPSDLGQLFKQAMGAGARVHTNSWGVPASSGGTVYDAQAAAVDRFVWENPEYSILFAAGNDGDHDRDGQTNYNTVSTPGTAKNAITVGASQNNRPDKKQGTNINGMASFSSRGPTGDNRVKPDLVAPGTWIASTRASKSTDNQFWAPHESNSRYGYMGGTSMATPLTAGATALVRQYYVEKAGITPRASLLKATLINGAAQMDQSLSWKDRGWGRVDLNGSLLARPFKFANEETPLQTGEQKSYTYEVKNGQPLKVTLVWTDYPANPAADKTLVNDLDLTVTGPDGKAIQGNHLIGSGADRLNNVENVVVTAPVDGTYTVSVRAHNVPQGPQRFALVVSGQVEGGTGQPTPPPTNPNPPPEDKQAPTAKVTSPVAGSTVSGVTTITADATDNVGVTKVIFYVDGQEHATASAAPFSVEWDTTRAGNGPRTIVVNAYDKAGNVGKSAPVKVTVSNGSVTERQELQFTGKAPFYGLSNRYFIDVKSGGTVTAELGTVGYANLQMAAYDSAGKQVAAGTGTTLNFTATAGGTYAISVIGLGGWADYALKVSYPPAAGATALTRSGRLSALGERMMVQSVTLGAAGSLNASLTAKDGRADLDLYLIDASGRIIAMAQSPNLNPETVSARVAPGTYRLYLVADSGQTDFQLQVSYPK